jgi:hypothetical protein
VVLLGTDGEGGCCGCVAYVQRPILASKAATEMRWEMVQCCGDFTREEFARLHEGSCGEKAEARIIPATSGYHGKIKMARSSCKGDRCKYEAWVCWCRRR